MTKKNFKEGVKFDKGKERYDLLASHSLHEVAKVYTMGAEKYDDNNWRQGILWGRIFGAAMRHLWAFWRGEDIDPESGLHHLAHASWGCLTLLEYTETHPEFDDRGDAVQSLRYRKADGNEQSSSSRSKRNTQTSKRKGVVGKRKKSS